MYQADFQKTVRIVKKFVKTDRPIRVRRQKLADDGWCNKKKDCFLIQINKNLPDYFAIDVLIHEAAHVLSWGQDLDDHGPNWGKAYSKVYRIFLREYFS